MTYRWRDIPSIPLLILLHVLFTLSSLFVRLYESIVSYPPDSPLSTCPKHIALVLAPREEDGGYVSTKEKAVERRAVVESIRRVVQWAGEEGVEEISVWDETGVALRYKQDIIDDFRRLPLSPPTSIPSTPTKASTSLPQQLAQDNEMNHSNTCTLYPVSAKPLHLHLLPITAKHVIADLTRRFATRNMNVNQKTIDTAVKTALGFHGDPDLLIVHPTYTPSFLRALLPRPPPELHDYPFWPLRITEIYQYPTPLPIPQPFRDLFVMLHDRAQVSSLPLVRKVARSIPARDPSVEIYVRGAVSRDEWEGAMRAWGQVEQRLGK